MGVGTKVFLLTLGIVFLLAAIITPLVVLMSKSSIGDISYGDFIYQYNIKDGNVYYDIKKYIGQRTEEVVIPGEYNGAPVIGILKNAFNGNTSGVVRNIKKITFDTSSGNGISRIDSGAFVRLESLREFYLPDCVNKIESGAFSGCVIRGDFVVEDLSAFYKNTSGYIGAKMTLSSGAFSNCSVGGKLTVKNNSSASIVPSEVMQAFGKLGAAKVELGKSVNVFDLGTYSFNTYLDLEELTIFTNKNNNNAGGAYTQNNFDLSNVRLLKKLNINFGDQEKLLFGLTQKFVKAPIETVNVGFGVTSIGSKTFTGYSNLTTLNIENTQTDSNGALSENLEIGVDLNFVPSARYTGININLTSYNFGTKTALRFDYDNNASTGVTVETCNSEKVYSCALTSAFTSNFDGYKIHTLTIDHTIEQIYQEAFGSYFRQNLADDDYYKLNFATENDKSAVKLSANIFGNGITAESLVNILGRIDVTGPHTAERADGTDIYVSFNTAPGSYAARHTYNGSLVFGNASIKVTFDKNYPESLTNFPFEWAREGATESPETVLISSLSSFKMPYNKLNSSNEYMIIGWADTPISASAQNNFTVIRNADGSYSYADGTPINNFKLNAEQFPGNMFEYKASDWDNWTGFEFDTADKVYKLNLYAMWQKKEYVTVTYVPDFIGGAVYEVAGRAPSISYYVARVPKNGSLGSEAIYLSDESGLVTSYDPSKENSYIRTPAAIINGSAMPTIYQYGRQFMGWSTTQGAAEADADITKGEYVVTGDITLYAVWTEIKYQINFYAGDNKDTDATSFTYAYGFGQNANEDFFIPTVEQLLRNNSNLPNSFKNVGYTFKAWDIYSQKHENFLISVGGDGEKDIEYWNDSSRTMADFIDFIVKNGGDKYKDLKTNNIQIDLYSYYRANEYTLRYTISASDGESLASSTPTGLFGDMTFIYGNDNKVTIADGKDYVLRTGYVFIGWQIKQKIYNADGSYTTDWAVLIGANHTDPFNTAMLLRKRARINDVDNLTYEQAQVAENGVDFELKPIWQTNFLRVIINPNNGQVNGGAEKLGLLYSFSLNKPTLKNGTEVIENIFELITRAGHVLMGVGINAQGTIGEGDPTFVFNDKGQICLKTANAETGADELVPVTGESILKAYFGVTELTHEQGATASVELFAYWRAHKYNLVVDFGDEGTLNLGEVTFGSGYKSITELDEDTKNKFAEIVAKIKAKGIKFTGIVTENGELVYNETGKATKSTFDFAFNKEGEITLYPQTDDLKYKVKLVSPSTWVAGNKYGIDTITANKLSLSIGGNTLESYDEDSYLEIKLGEKIKITATAGEYFHFKRAMFVDADGNEIEDFGAISAEYEITLSNLSSVSYDDNGELVIAISAEFERDEYKLIFKLSDAVIENSQGVKDWGLSSKEDYYLTQLAADGVTIEYIYAYVFNLSGIETLFKEITGAGTLGFVKKADGTFSYVGWPTITLNNGHINNWTYAGNIVAANYKVSSLSGADQFKDDKVIELSASWGDYNTNVVTIKAGGSLPQGLSLNSAINAFTFTQTYSEGGTNGGDAVWTEADGAYTVAGLRDKASVVFNITPNAGYTITGATSSTVSGTALSGFAYTGNQITFVMGQEAATITLTITVAQYTIVFDSNGGYGSAPSSITCFVDQAVTLSLNTFARTGYVFLGWARDASATTPEFGDGAEVVSLSTTDGATVTLYAVWGEKGTDGREGYTIEYNSNNIDINNNSLISAVSGTMSNQTGLSYMQTLDLYDNAFSAAGYTASCWFISSEVRGGGKAWLKNVALKDMIAEAISAGQDVEGTNKIVVYVHWTANTYTLTLNAGSVTIDGVGTFSGAFVNNGNATTLALSIKFGQTFGEATLGGAVVGLVTPSLSINDNYVATFAGYRILGTSTSVDANTQFTSESNVEIEATWNYTQGEYKLTLIANGGLINGNATYETTVGAGNALSVLGDGSLNLTRTGFTFVSWNDAQDGNGNAYTATSVMPAGSLTLYAQWTATSYRVKLDLNGGSGVTAGGAISGTFGDGDVFEVKFDEAFSLVGATKTGYAFKWWTVSGANASTALWGESSDAITSKITSDSTECKNDATGDVWFKGLASTGGAEVTIKAYFVAIQYTISIDMNRDAFGLNAGSGTLNKTEIKGIYDSALTELSSISVTQAPTKKGYTITLDGFANKSTGGMVVNESTILNESNIVSINHTENKATIYAQWSATANQYTLTLNAGSATVEGTTINAYFGTEGTTSTTCQFTFDDALISISVPTLVVTGYGATYVWWVDFDSDGKIANDGSETLSHEQLEALVWTYDKDITAVAQWTISANTVNVKIIHMVENAADSNTTSYTDNGYKNYAGTNLTVENIKALMSESLARAGLTAGEFDAEKKSSGGTGKYYLNAIRTQKDGTALGASDTVLVKGDGTTEIYMVYKRYTYTITVKFVAGVSQLKVAGKTSTNSDIVATGIKFGAGLNIELSIAEGYNFTMWELTGDGSVSNKTDTNITFTCGTADAVLTPKFSLKTFTLKLNSRGVTSAPGFTLNGSYYERTVEYGAALRAKDNSGVLDGVTVGLAGHKLADSNNPFVFGDNGSGNAVSVGAVMPAGNTTVSVKWETLAYETTIEIKDESGSLSLVGFKTIVVKTAGGTDTGTQINSSSQKLNIKYGVAHVIELTLNDGYYVVSAVGSANATVTTEDLNKQNTTGKVNFTVTGDATITITFAVIKYKARIYVLGNIPSGLSVIGKIGNQNYTFISTDKTNTEIENIPYTGQLISSRITLSSQYYHQTKWSWTAAGVQTEVNVDGAYFVKPDSVYDASGEIITDGKDLSVEITAVWEANTYRLVFKTPESITVGGQTIQLTSDHYTMKGVSASYIEGTGFVANVTFGATGKVSNYVTLTFANGNYIFNFTGWQVTVDGANKGAIATDAALNFTASSAWFNGLGATNGSEIVFTPNVEITKIKISLKLNFQNLTTDAYDLYLEEGSAFTIDGETATVGKGGVLTFNVTLASNLADILNSILAQTNTASGSGGAYTLTDEAHALSGDPAEMVFIKYFTHNQSSKTLDISAAGTTFTADLTRKTFTIKIILQEDRYTQTLVNSLDFARAIICKTGEFGVGISDNYSLVFVQNNLIRYNQIVDITAAIAKLFRRGFTYNTITSAPVTVTSVIFMGDSAHTPTTAGTGTSSESGVANKLSNSGLNIRVNWTLNAKKITFDEIDGDFSGDDADPIISDAQGWATSSDGYGNSGRYNAEKDLYYGLILDANNIERLGFYRIIPAGTAAGGIKNFMPTPDVKDSEDEAFSGWYSGSDGLEVSYEGKVYSDSTGNYKTINLGSTSYEKKEVGSFLLFSSAVGSTFKLTLSADDYYKRDIDPALTASIYLVSYNQKGAEVAKKYISTIYISAGAIWDEDDDGNQILAGYETKTQTITLNSVGYYKIEFTLTATGPYGIGDSQVSITCDRNNSAFVPSNTKSYSSYSPYGNSQLVDSNTTLSADTTLYAYIAYGKALRLVVPVPEEGYTVEMPFEQGSGWTVISYGEGKAYQKAKDVWLVDRKLPTPICDGYKFVGWFDANGEELREDLDKFNPSSESYDPTALQDLYFAKWEKVAGTVKFVYPDTGYQDIKDDNGGSISIKADEFGGFLSLNYSFNGLNVGPTTATYTDASGNTAATVTIKMPLKQGSRFKYWAVCQNGDTSAMEEITSFEMSETNFTKYSDPNKRSVVYIYAVFEVCDTIELNYYPTIVGSETSKSGWSISSTPTETFIINIGDTIEMARSYINIDYSNILPGKTHERFKGYLISQAAFSDVTELGLKTSNITITLTSTFANGHIYDIYSSATKILINDKISGTLKNTGYFYGFAGKSVDILAQLQEIYGYKTTVGRITQNGYKFIGYSASSDDLLIQGTTNPYFKAELYKLRTNVVSYNDGNGNRKITQNNTTFTVPANAEPFGEYNIYSIWGKMYAIYFVNSGGVQETSGVSYCVGENGVHGKAKEEVWNVIDGSLTMLGYNTYPYNWKDCYGPTADYGLAYSSTYDGLVCQAWFESVKPTYSEYDFYLKIQSKTTGAYIDAFSDTSVSKSQTITLWTASFAANNNSDFDASFTMWRNAQGTKKYSAGSSYTLETLAEDCADGNVITVYADYDSSETKYSLVVYCRAVGDSANTQTEYYSGSVTSYQLPTKEQIEANNSQHTFIAPSAFIDIVTKELYALGSTINVTKDTILQAYYGDLYRIKYWVMETGSSGNSYVPESEQLAYEVNLNPSRYSYTSADGKLYQGYEWNTKSDGSGNSYKDGKQLDEDGNVVDLFCMYKESENKLPIIYRLNFNLSSVSFSGSLQIMLIQNEMTVYGATQSISASANSVDFETTETSLNSYVVRVFTSSNYRLCVANNGVVTFDYVGIDQDGRYRIYAATVSLIETNVFMVGNRTYTDVKEAINAANGGVIDAYATGDVKLGDYISYAIRINDILGAGYTITTAVNGCDIDITGKYSYVQGRVHLEKGGVYKFAEDYNAGTKNIAYTTSSTDPDATVTIIIKGVTYSYFIKDLVA